MGVRSCLLQCDDPPKHFLQYWQVYGLIPVCVRLLISFQVNNCHCTAHITCIFGPSSVSNVAIFFKAGFDWPKVYATLHPMSSFA